MSEHSGKHVTQDAVGVAQQGANATRPPAGSERRRNPRIRVPRNFLALIGPASGGGASTPAAVSPRDLSRTGLGFYHSADLQPGTLHTLTLKALGGELVRIGAKVVRRRQVREGVYDIGVEFEREIEPGRFVTGQPAPRRVPAAPLTPESAAQARAHIAELAGAMKRMAEAETPINDLFDKVDELLRICDSARPADE